MIDHFCPWEWAQEYQTEKVFVALVHLLVAAVRYHRPPEPIVEK
jgi:hypothetical protein